MKKHQRNVCCYCRENKIHPAFEDEKLCSTCASDVIEDYKKRKDAFRIARLVKINHPHND